MMSNYLYVFIGGGVGSILRLFISGWSLKAFGNGGTFPVGTITVNLLGSLLVGLLWAVFEDTIKLTPVVKNLVFIGFLGGFTTFSTYTLESMNLLRNGEYIKATSNIIISNGLGLVLVLLGFIVGKFILKLK